ncbi:MAG: CHRD domain-containing protein [Calditrichia bacterium]
MQRLSLQPFRILVMSFLLMFLLTPLFLIAKGSDKSAKLGLHKRSLTEELAEHQTGNFRTAITNEGTIGMLNEYGGIPGFEWPLGSNQLFEAGLMIGIAPDHVVDASRVIIGGSQNVLDADFFALSPILEISAHIDSTVYATKFNDSGVLLDPLADDGPNTPIGLEITQSSYSYNVLGNQGYLILKYQITNTGNAPLTNVAVGAFMDWDINTFTSNTGQVDFDSVSIPTSNGDSLFLVEFPYLYDSSSPTPYLGVVPLSQAEFWASRIADNTTEIFPSGAASLTEANKYAYMTQRRVNDPFGDPVGPADKSIVFGLGPYNIPANGTIIVGYAIAGGATVDEFKFNGRAAIRQWQRIKNQTFDIDIPAASFAARLSNTNVVPPNESAGSGEAFFELSDDSTSLTYNILFENLSDSLTSAAIYLGKAGEAGSVVRGITDFILGNASGVWRSTDSEPLTPLLVEALFRNELYVELASSAHPQGELRGQIISPDSLSPILGTPRNFDASSGSGQVDLTWEQPLSIATTELSYDDGTAEGDISIGGTAGGEIAVRFTPTVYPARVLGIKVSFGDSLLVNPTIVTDWGVWTGNASGPQTQLATDQITIERGGFQIIDLGQAVEISSDDFFISFTEGISDGIAINWDTSSPSVQRAWINAPSIGFPWRTFASINASFDNNILIRALVVEGVGPEARLVELSGQSKEIIGYNIYRADLNGPFALHAQVGAEELGYSDNSGISGEWYRYFVTGIYPEGQSERSNILSLIVVGLEEEPGIVPEEFSLAQNFPNPFNPSTSIRYGLKQREAVTLRIFDTLGREVVRLVDEEQNAGQYKVDWNGMTANGQPVSSGIYFYQLEAGDFMQSRKMILLQ